jgi:hypothetical protein
VNVVIRMLFRIGHCPSFIAFILLSSRLRYLALKVKRNNAGSPVFILDISIRWTPLGGPVSSSFAGPLFFATASHGI